MTQARSMGKIGVFVLIIFSISTWGAMGPTELNRQGFDAMKAADYFSALELFRQAVRADPRMAKAHWNLACAVGMVLASDQTRHRYKGLQGEAFDSLNKAISLDPSRKSRLFTEPEFQVLRSSEGFWASGGYSGSAPELAVLFSEDKYARRYAVEPLFKKDPRLAEKVVPMELIVEAMIDGDDGGAWRTSAMDILKRKGKSALPTLLKVLNDGDCLHGAVGVEALGSEAAPLAPALAACLENNSNFVMDWVAPAFIHLGEASKPVLKKALLGTNSMGSGNAAEIIGRMNAAEFVPDLVSASDRSANVLGRVQKALSRIGTSEALQALRTIPTEPSVMPPSGRMSTVRISSNGDRLVDESGRTILQSTQALVGLEKQILEEFQPGLQPSPVFSQTVISNNGKMVAVVVANRRLLLLDVESRNIRVFPGAGDPNDAATRFGVELGSHSWSPGDHFLAVNIGGFEGAAHWDIYDLVSMKVVTSIDDNLNLKRNLSWISWKTLEGELDRSSYGGQTSRWAKDIFSDGDVQIDWGDRPSP